MPRKGKTIEKPNNFIGSLKRQFNGMKKWRTPLIIAIILAAFSSIFSLISPNKLSDITDEISKGLAPNTEVLEVLMNDIQTELSDPTNISEKASTIMTDNSISNSSKTELINLINNKS